MHINDEGLVEGVRCMPSPNCDGRPAGGSIELIVIHAISLPPGQFGGPAVIDFFANRLDTGAHPYYASLRDLRVSAHFFIRRDGGVVQFVPCVKRAWHAGASNWKGRDRCNDFSIGIELEGSDDTAFADAQYAALAKLALALRRTYPIKDIVGHSDIAPGRKSDPGPHFDWRRFRALMEQS